ncbi:uncharacterized protein Tco025E_08631 [Trypanosoma conorhini]|uniref:Uncharacterized protein n=1 Tax=Trypanosoma conorhini TaxID=83891 RepID=A0A3R7N7E6_9TRYP|nr:uncharacterized protein Tco025E_08631 [Trypanosoma conorhini]RNF01530.1 hypothetical protein Tco025E_08631 [Trypanosoma conorhini]
MSSAAQASAPQPQQQQQQQGSHIPTRSIIPASVMNVAQSREASGPAPPSLGAGPVSGGLQAPGRPAVAAEPVRRSAPPAASVAGVPAAGASGGGAFRQQPPSVSGGRQMSGSSERATTVLLGVGRSLQTPPSLCLATPKLRRERNTALVGFSTRRGTPPLLVLFFGVLAQK